MAEATVTRTVFHAYRIRAEGEYATICMQHWSAGTEGTPSHRYAGEMLIHSGYGSWGYTWDHCGVPFPRFLAGLERDYLMGKLLGADYSVFDADASVASLRKIMLEGDPNAELIEFNRLMSGVLSEAEFAHAVAVSDLPDEITSEPWNFIEKKAAPEAVWFWRMLWPPFVEALRKDFPC